MSTALTAYPSQAEWGLMWNMGKSLVASRFLPKAVDTPEKAVAIMLKGRELGWPPMRSFQHIHVIEGKPALSAEGMLALIYERVPGAIIRIIETSNERCVIEAARPGQQATTFVFTIEDAQRAGVVGKDNWRKYPRAMLRARCISEMARATFPDALMGCSYVPEELGAEVNEEGEVITVDTKQSAPDQDDAGPSTSDAEKGTPQQDVPQVKTEPAAPTFDTIFDGSPRHERFVADMLANSKVRREHWDGIQRELKGKPIRELKTIVPKVLEAAKSQTQPTRRVPTYVKEAEIPF